MDSERLLRARQSIAAIRSKEGPERNGKDWQKGTVRTGLHDNSRFPTVPPSPPPTAVQDLQALSRRAAFVYQLESVTLDANHVPHSYGPARVSSVSDLPPRTHEPHPNTEFVRVSAALPYVTPMVPSAPSAAHIARFQAALRQGGSESMAITAHLEPALATGGPVSGRPGRGAALRYVEIVCAV
jgi:hypothetical protein